MKSLLKASPDKVISDVSHHYRRATQEGCALLIGRGMHHHCLPLGFAGEFSFTDHASILSCRQGQGRRPAPHAGSNPITNCLPAAALRGDEPEGDSEAQVLLSTAHPGGLLAASLPH
jgi:hypothetical protein